MCTGMSLSCMENKTDVGVNLFSIQSEEGVFLNIEKLGFIFVLFYMGKCVGGGVLCTTKTSAPCAT